MTQVKNGIMGILKKSPGVVKAPLYESDHLPNPDALDMSGLTPEEAKIAKGFGMDSREYLEYKGQYVPSKTQEEVNEAMGLTDDEVADYKDPDYRPETEVDGKGPDTDVTSPVGFGEDPFKIGDEEDE